MRLIEADERQTFLATLQRKGLAEGEFELLETDTTDPKGDENVGLQGYVTVTRLSTQIARVSDRISKLAFSIRRNEIPHLIGLQVRVDRPPGARASGRTTPSGASPMSAPRLRRRLRSLTMVDGGR